ncbi:MAG TPA: bifunctional 4-hydroxy-2-oxoglutarate aldolase/2-dehydro-3-deoxy-phosphogluconate aldolase [Candidatus Saccharimonadales bacterium]|nr:bifunctional 4-hydroxy-2-oxoglutarate aldolase/2-dehydro-3-deoxy-phosphogluconate aldolase [Candidatus Saccharimonadales bacterium]
MAEAGLRHFEEIPVVGVLRGIEASQLKPVIETAVDAGLATIEFTVNTPGSWRLLERAAGNFGDDIDLGCGTVLSVEQAQQAVGSGAQFIVAPTCSAEVAEWCAGEGIHYIPGALTPTEIEDAWKMKPYMVKVFPAKSLGGPEYIEQLRGPFNKQESDAIRLIVSGGVNVDTIESYFRAGVDAVCVGASTFAPELLAQRDWRKLGEQLTKIVSITKAATD